MKGFSLRLASRLALIGGVGVLGFLMQESTPKLEAAASFKTVVIDVGHGGHDKGGTAGLIYEKHLCLDVARRLDVYLRERGVRTVMTRTRDTYISLPSRCYIANRQNDAVFVSIHFNETPRAGAKGIETFYAGSAGRDLGERVHNQLIGTLKPEDRGLKWRQYYVLRNTKVPAILVECGFLSNSWERERCLAPWYRQLAAESIGTGILRYASDQKRGAR